MKKSIKILISTIVALIALWLIIFFIDYSRCSNFKEPIFVKSGVTADDGGSGIYYGLGYKVKTEKTISAEYGPTLVRVEMYMFDKFICGAIADMNNESSGVYQELEEEQFEFIATIIGVYDNTILVEPEEGTNERKSSDKISIGITKHTNGINDFYVVGNKVKITYNGVIMESYPAQIVVTKVELIGGYNLSKDNIKEEIKNVSMDEIVNIMNENQNYIILDVRTVEEYNDGHIPNAICIPNETISEDVINKLPNKEQLLLIYCRSGNRSKQAANKLQELGYTKLVEFGGIIDWKGEIVK